MTRHATQHDGATTTDGVNSFPLTLKQEIGRLIMTLREASWRAHASGAVIKTAWKLFANTPVQKLPLTARIYARVSRFGSVSDEVTTNFRGVQLTPPTKDITTVPGLVGGFYEKIELDVFERLAAISRTIVDVGANMGCIAASQHRVMRFASQVHLLGI